MENEKNKDLYPKELDAKILSLKIEYENALKGTDKMDALKKGREYYLFLRLLRKEIIVGRQYIMRHLWQMTLQQ